MKDERIRRAAELSVSGLRKGEIAKLMRVDRNTISNWAQTEEWRNHCDALLERTTADIQEMLVSFSRLALVYLASVLEHDDPEVQVRDKIRAAEIILNRHEMAPAVKTDEYVKVLDELRKVKY